MDTRVRSYQRRGGRLGPQLQHAWEHDLPALALPADRWDLSEVFEGCQRYVMEIGSGMGEATLAMAKEQPHTGLIAVEVHDRGVAALARGVAAMSLRNVRIYVGDAVDALSQSVAPASLDEVRIWFPDPWPKARHHKRRLVTSAFLDVLVSRLVTGGVVHVATDHEDYAEVIAGVLADADDLEPLVVDGPRPDWRPETKFERAGLAAGRRSHDFIYARRPLRPVEAD